MSIGFEIIKRRKGLRLELGRRLDLSGWDIEHSAGRISCKPRPMEFLTMAFGAIIFMFLALFLAASAFNPSWLGGSSKTSTELLHGENGAGVAMPQLPEETSSARSKFKGDAATMDELRESTSRMVDQLTKNMTAEEKAKFMAEVNGRSLQRVSKPSARLNGIVTWAILVVRLLAILPVALCSLLGGVCLYRALLYFRDKIELSVRQNAILFERPKLVGGTQERVFPIEQLAAITCYAVRHSGGRKGTGAHVQWCAQLLPKDSSLPNIEFDIEHLHFTAELTTLPERIRSFALAIREMSGLPVLVRRPSQ